MTTAPTGPPGGCVACGRRREVTTLGGGLRVCSECVAAVLAALRDEEQEPAQRADQHCYRN